MRRVTILSALVVFGVVATLSRPVAQSNVAEIEQVKSNLYVITGGGGNTAAFVTAGGVVVVDTKNPGWGSAILDKIRTVTDKPVTMIVNTHTHGDHVGSNIDFSQPVEVVRRWCSEADAVLRRRNRRAPILRNDALWSG